MLTLRAGTHGHRPAIVHGGRATTYDELEAEASATARRLAALGVGAGDRVATTLPAGLDFAALLHGAGKLGAVFAPLNTRLTAAERRLQVEDAAPRVVVDSSLEGAEAEVDLRTRVEPDDPQTLLFTSGTGGRPTPVVLTFANHRASAMASAWNLGVAPDDRWLCVLPPFHVGGLAILLRSAIYGTAAVLHERFDPDAAASAIAAGHATLVSLVPTMLGRLRVAGLGHAPALRAMLVGGGPMPGELLDWARGAGLPVVLTYGMTETASQVAVCPIGEEGGDGGTAGRPLPGAELEIAAGRGGVGEILVRGPMVAPGALAEDGWLHTGDRGSIDGAGRLRVEGRLDGLIVTGGENVSAEEVEDALLAHPAVIDAGVVGHPDREWGRAVTAYVVAPGAEPGDLEAHCHARLAPFKVPKRIHLVDTLPRNAAGKLVRRRLADTPDGG